MDRRLRVLGHVARLGRSELGPDRRESGAPGDDRRRHAEDAAARADAQSAAAAARQRLDRDADPQAGETRVTGLKRSVRRLAEAPQTEDGARRLEAARRALDHACADLEDALRGRHQTMRRAGLRP